MPIGGPAGVKNIAGFRPPQALFAGLPSSGPGGVTPQISASLPIEGMDIQDQIAAYNFAKQKKADRAAEWAKAAAANRVRKDRFAGTGLNAQGWREINPQEERLKQAFAEVYTPQLRRTFHDQVIASPTAAGEQARRRYGTAGKIGGLWSSGTGYNTGRIRKEGQNQERLQRTLAQMWRAETDPYLKAVGGGMKASTAMMAMQPGQRPYGYGLSGTNPPVWKRPKE